jgi:2-polyprenyl-3-methyl-5-hydroxy-6-metoxy-1,4-benzoquinol methylase
MTRQRFESCPNCTGRSIRPVQRFQHIFKCQNCDFVFDQRIATKQMLESHYSVYAYSEPMEVSPPTILSYNRLLDEYEPFRKNGALLDYGCGQGDFLIEAKKRGWATYGIEYSHLAIEVCRQRGLSVVTEEQSDSIFAGINFDVVTSFEVIEHLSSANPMFDLAFRKLRVGGLFYITTPNFNALLRFLEGGKFKMIYFPEHISCYTSSAIRHLAKQHNFKEHKIVTTGLDIVRLKALFLKNRYADKSWISNRSENDRFRLEIENKSHLRFFKNKINSVLSFFGVGDTLKCYFIRQL